MAGVVLVAMAASSCNQDAVVCGAGTLEIDGVCEAIVRAAPPAECCGLNTEWDATLLTCVGVQTTFCDEVTTVTVREEDGTSTCIGSGPRECGLPCPTPDPGLFTVCGFLHDVETDERIEGPATGGLCDPALPSASGSCSLEIQFYDALQFADDPSGATPLEAEYVRVNDCGEFVAHNLPVPALEFIGIGVDDAIADDRYVQAGVALAAVGGQRVNELRVYAMRHATDDMWTDSAGMPFGSQTFVDRGVYAGIFKHRGQPVQDVVLWSAGAPVPGSDYYFSDASPTQRTTVVAGQNSTGPNGTALLVDIDLVRQTGQGGEIGECAWPNPLGDAIPGVAFVQELDSVFPGTGERCE